MKQIEVINASAGSGKTYSLTARVVAILKEGMAPEALMATTFTNKAAAELRERIRVKLLESGDTEQAERVGDGFIGTVNSICARLLREYALEAGLSPAVVVMPEEDSERLFQIAIDAVIAAHGDRMEPPAARMSLDGSGQGYAKTGDWRSDVKAVVDLARSNLIGPEDLRVCGEVSWASLQRLLGDPGETHPDDALRKALILSIGELDGQEGLTKTTEKALETMKTALQAMEKGDLSWVDWVRLSKLKAAKDGKVAVERVQAQAGEVLRHPGLQADLREITVGVFDCAAGALEEYQAYKAAQGLMDFADQETSVLDLARHNPGFRKSMGERLDILMVDEFQDTSPVQLALFLALGELAGRSVWVGDPKQAIYGFRGTDPQLMNEVVRRIPDTGVLDYSWRSRENLVRFTNGVFSEVFHALGPEKTCLKIPPQRREAARGGTLEAWHLEANRAEQEAGAVANGVVDLLERNPAVRPGDVAVLCRTRQQIGQIASSLEQRGIQVSVSQGELTDAPECRLALAGLRYMNNGEDELALAEIMCLDPRAGNRKDWLADLLADPAGAKERWRKDPLVAGLQDGQGHMKYWTPLEALEEAIFRTGLLEVVRLWPDPRRARNNLDALRGACNRYIEQCQSHRSAATASGFITYMQQTGGEKAQGTGERTVQLLTYHGAKGLEWPWVVLTGLDSRRDPEVFGVHVEPAAVFRPEEPLAGRSIRYWPWPFGTQGQVPTLSESIQALPVFAAIRDMEEQEARRLLYVGMTRARDGLVLAVRKTSGKAGVSLKTGWLDTLRDKEAHPVLDLMGPEGDWEMLAGTQPVTLNIRTYSPDSAVVLRREAPSVVYGPVLPDEVPEYLPATVAPSATDLDEEEERLWDWTTVARSGHRMAIRGKPDMACMGNAVHGYLALQRDGWSRKDRVETAATILKHWGLETVLEAEDLVTAAGHFWTFVDERYPEARAFPEWPVSCRNDRGQRVEGWIDLLLETADEIVIIDHKSYPGTDGREQAMRYTGQLLTYREAVERATGKPVTALLIHLPVSGQVLQLGKRSQSPDPRI